MRVRSQTSLLSAAALEGGALPLLCGLTHARVLAAIPAERGDAGDARGGHARRRAAAGPPLRRWVARGQPPPGCVLCLSGQVRYEFAPLHVHDLSTGVWQACAKDNAEGDAHHADACARNMHAR